jgi:hypothetical protein
MAKTRDPASTIHEMICWKDNTLLNHTGAFKKQIKKIDSNEKKR